MYEMKSSCGDEKERSEVHLLMGKMKVRGSKFRLSVIKSCVLDNLSEELRVLDVAILSDRMWQHCCSEWPIRNDQYCKAPQ